MGGVLRRVGVRKRPSVAYARDWHGGVFGDRLERVGAAGERSRLSHGGWVRAEYDAAPSVQWRNFGLRRSDAVRQTGGVGGDGEGRWDVVTGIHKGLQVWFRGFGGFPWKRSLRLPIGFLLS